MPTAGIPPQAEALDGSAHSLYPPVPTFPTPPQLLRLRLRRQRTDNHRPDDSTLDAVAASSDPLLLWAPFSVFGRADTPPLDIALGGIQIESV
jgi:hypothetical protein